MNGYGLSADGNKIMVTFNNNNGYVSSNFGATMDPLTMPSSSANGSAMSGDGNTIAVITDGGTKLYISHDFGTSWTLAAIPALASNLLSNPYVNSDGSAVTVLGKDSGFNTGYIYLSLDGGTSFTRVSGASAPGDSGYGFWTRVKIAP